MWLLHTDTNNTDDADNADDANNAENADYYYYSSNLRALAVCDYGTLSIMWQDLSSYLTTYIYKYIRPFQMIFFCSIIVKLFNCLLRSRDSECWI